MLSSVRCDTVCRNGNTGVVKGVVMPSHLDPDHRVPGPHDGLVRHASDDAEARTEVVLVQPPGGAGLVVAAEIFELLRLQVEDRDLIVLFG